MWNNIMMAISGIYAFIALAYGGKAAEENDIWGALRGLLGCLVGVFAMAMCIAQAGV